ncbi:MAG: hypothetical protein ABI333_22755 [bacterium]
MQTFDGFEARDYEAYAPEKWLSNVYNLDRMRVKEKLAALGQALSPLQPSPDGAPLTCEVSIEHPAVWNNNQVSEQSLYFTRSEQERNELSTRNTRAKSMSFLVADPSPHQEHIFLCVVVRAMGIELGLKLHSNAVVDRENMVSKLNDRWHMQAFAEIVAALPEEIQIGLTGESQSSPSELGVDQLRALVQRFETAAREAKPSIVPGDAKVLCFLKTYPSDYEGCARADFAEQARADLEKLLPLYDHLAWSRQNDFVEVKETIREEKRVKKSRGLAKNDSVKVVRGLFTGKTGVVMDTDSKGSLKVRLGTMVVRIDAKDVVPG